MDWQKDLGQLKDVFDRDGFVVIPGFYTPQETETLNAHIDRFIAETLPGLPSDAAFYEVKGQTESIMRLQGMASYDDHFKELTESDRFAKLAELLLADGIISKNMEWFTKPARSDAETPPHQDGFYFMLEPNEALTLWLALDTVNDENGCIHYTQGFSPPRHETPRTDSRVRVLPRGHRLRRGGLSSRGSHPRRAGRYDCASLHDDSSCRFQFHCEPAPSIGVSLLRPTC